MTTFSQWWQRNGHRFDSPALAAERAWEKRDSLRDWTFEQHPYVCSQCGSDNWHANAFYANWRKCWEQPEPIDGNYEARYWCHDCEGETEITEKSEWEPEA